LSTLLAGVTSVFFKDPQAEFSCPKQAILLEHMVKGQENVFGIMGTSSGKTTLIMLLSKMYGNGLTTLVVLPLSALHGDFERRSHKHRLIVSRWHPNPNEFNPNADIVTCAVQYLELTGFHECIDLPNIKNYSNNCP
jgi:ABC-type antimicrobial peptide transport system ATPase subunit